jgi:transcriptional regulator with XRE-family HTH domain
MTSLSHKWHQLWNNLQSLENRRELATEIATGLAFQIKALREKKGWTQAELARQTDKDQPTISQLEDPNYGRYSLATLKRLANAFDVALVVRFVPFSELVDWLVNLTPEKLAPANYDEERERLLSLGDASFPLPGNTQVVVHGGAYIGSDYIVVNSFSAPTAAYVQVTQPLAGIVWSPEEQQQHAWRSAGPQPEAGILVGERSFALAA